MDWQPPLKRLPREPLAAGCSLHDLLCLTKPHRGPDTFLVSGLFCFRKECPKSLDLYV
jgi:hypothetical protein